jgi:hypothetical protein
MAELTDVKVRLEPEMSDEFKELVTAASTVEGDVVDKVNAGAALIYALYHSSAEVIQSLPGPVADAYGRACDVYAVNSRRY